MFPSASGEFGVHRERLEGRDGFIGDGQVRRRNRPPLGLWPFHLARKRRFAPRVKIRELNFAPARREFRRTFQFLHPAPIARLLLDDLLTIHEQRAAVHLEKKRVEPRVRDVHPAVVFDRRVLRDFAEAQALQRKVVHLPRPLRNHLLTPQSLPHLPAIKRVAERPRHARILQEKVRDALHVFRGEPHVRHPSRGPARVRLAQKIHEALDAVFFFQRTERNGILRQQLRALFIAR